MSAYHHRVMTFADLADACARRASRKVELPGGSGNLSQDIGTEPAVEWDDKFGWKGAVTAVRKGWNAGNQTVRAALDMQTTEDSIDGTWDADVCGQYVDVAAYVAGQPDCMMRKGSAPAPRRVRLVLSSGMIASVDAQDAVQYATAAAGFAAMLIGQGLDVAITSLYVGTDDSRIVTIPVTVKEYGQEPDASRIAFSTHPAFLRRVLFAVRELDPEMPFRMRSGGYGRTCYDWQSRDLIRDAIPDADGETLICLPGIMQLDSCHTAGKFLEGFLHAARKQATTEGGAP